MENLDDDKVKKMFLDVDFRNRTLLKVVTYNGFAPIFASYKLNILLNEIWLGKGTLDCDGNYSDFSIMTWLCVHPTVKVPGKPMGLGTILTNHFRVGTQNQKYWF